MNKCLKLKYAEVAPAIPLKPAATQTYTYQIPTHFKKIKEFSVVQIPLGSRSVKGVVLSIHHQRPPYPTKIITKGLGVSLTDTQVKFATQIARISHGGLGFTLRLFLPPTFPSKKPVPEKTSSSAPITKPSLILEHDLSRRFKEITKLINKQKDNQTLIIVPELWLIDKIFQSLPKHMQKQAAVLSSKVTPKQVTKIWHETHQGNIKIIIGTQKALYLPYQDLGLVVIEESFFSTHKLWDAYPRLDNMYAAPQLAKIHHAEMIYSSSIMPLSLQVKKLAKEITVLKDNPLKIKTKTISATFKDYDEKNLFPNQFILQLRMWLKAKQTVFIMYNRKSSWQSVICQKCEHVMRCDKCQAATSVKITGKAKKLHCTACDISTYLPTKCPKCHKPSLRFIGIGNDRVIDILKRIVPRADIIKLDATTKTTTDQLQKKLSKSGQHIILGTQAAFRLINQVKIDQAVLLFPERELNFPDFRSKEHVVYLIARLQQLISTRRSVTLVTKRKELDLHDDINKTYHQILVERRKLNYPPFNDMIRLTVTGKSEKIAMNKATKIREQINQAISQRLKVKGQMCIVRGPYQGYLKQKRGKYEVHLLLIGPLETIVNMHHKLDVDVADLNPERIL